MKFRQQIILLSIFSLSYESLAFTFVNNNGNSLIKKNKFSTEISLVENASMPEGITKKIIQEGSGSSINVGDVATVKYSCATIVDPKNENESSVTFSKGSSEKMVVGEGLMVDGWEIALLSMKKGERALFDIEEGSVGAEQYGYGVAGVPPIIKPNAGLNFDISVLNVEQGVELGTMAAGDDPLKPRDPKSIAEAYSTRRELAALEASDGREGIQGLIEKFKSYYFFGFFEGETGEQAPWYLRPSITFPLAFAVVGAAFYVSFQTGAIYERGSQSTDELDDFILTSFVTLVLSLLKM